LNPFSKYIECLNCGNELTNVSELSFNTPSIIQCDFCGQKYHRLTQTVKKVKIGVTILFVVLAMILGIGAWQMAGFSAALFALFPLMILYYFVLGFAVKKSIRY
jgi:hypothetical protein